MATTVWTSRRKWLGNLVPALFWVPFLIAGLIVMARQRDPLGLGLWLLVAGTVLGWLAVNLFGLFENERMRGQLERILGTQKKLPGGDRLFVGFATPKFSSALDPHEDVGFFSIEPDQIRFVSETREVIVPQESVIGVRFRANIHSLLLLGRWISVEGAMDDQPIRLLIEPRSKKTLLGNRRAGKAILAQLKAWAPKPPEPPETEDSDDDEEE